MTQRNHANCHSNVVLGVIGAGFLLMCIACGGGLTPEQRAAEEKRQASLTPEQRAAEAIDDKEKAATLFAKDSVRKFLKHPGDASFGKWDDPEVRFNPEQDTFLICSKVKAKNDLGKEATYQWEVIVMLDGKTWERASCTINGETVFTSSALLDKIIGTEEGRNEAAQAPK
jgi:hypothetical protein